MSSQSITQRVFKMSNTRKNQIMRSIDNEYWKKINVITAGNSIDNTTYIEGFFNINKTHSGTILDLIIKGHINSIPECIDIIKRNQSDSTYSPITSRQIEQYNTFCIDTLHNVLEPYIKYVRDNKLIPDVSVGNGTADFMNDTTVAEVKCSKYQYCDYAWIQMIIYGLLSENTINNYVILNPLTGTICELTLDKSINNNIRQELLYSQ